MYCTTHPSRRGSPIGKTICVGKTGIGTEAAGTVTLDNTKGLVLESPILCDWVNCTVKLCARAST